MLFTALCSTGCPANLPRAELEKYSHTLQTLAPKLWPAPAPPALPAAWDATTSIVIVRHPLARLVSVYYQEQKSTIIYAILNSINSIGGFILVSLLEVYPAGEALLVGAEGCGDGAAVTGGRSADGGPDPPSAHRAGEVGASH